jgi:hypothetical protein
MHIKVDIVLILGNLEVMFLCYDNSSTVCRLIILLLNVFDDAPVMSTLNWRIVEAEIVM